MDTAASTSTTAMQADAGDTAPKTSYGQILKSSAMVGGASVLTILIGMARTKAMAVMLGPAGFGLMGAFMSIVDLFGSIASMGLNRSGVRQIAESVSSGDSRRIAVTVTVLRRVAVALGVLGALLLAAFASPIALLSFGHDGYRAAVALLALAVFCKLVAEGQSALVQGTRRIADFAKIGVLGAAVGTLVALPLVYFLGEKGVALSIVAAAAVTALASWLYSRRIRVAGVQLTMRTLVEETGVLLKFGVAFMVSGLLMMGSAYAVRVMLVRFESLEVAGLFQAAWTLGGLYVSLILQSMGADFYPRLVAAAKDDAHCNRLVNEQTQVSVLLATTGVLSTLVLAPVVLVLFYSAGFGAAAEALRWICLGMMLRTLTWPMGYIIIAKGEQRLFILTEVAWTVAYLGLSYVCIGHFGLAGSGIAFCLSYLFHGAMLYPIVRRLSGYRYDARSMKVIALFLTITLVAFAGFALLPNLWANALGITLLSLSAILSGRLLLGLFSQESVPRKLRPLYRLLHA